MHKKRFLSAVLAIGVAVALAVSPAFAGGLEVLSDAELQELTASNAGDFGWGWKESNSNMNGVQLNGNFQGEAKALNINNANRSANNFQTNILTSGNDIEGFVSQYNKVIDSQQYVGLGSGGGDFGRVWGHGNSNVGGIQVNGFAQQNAHGLNIANTHRSADNYQLNLLESGSDISGMIMQTNKVIDSQWHVGGANNAQTNILSAVDFDGFVYQKNLVDNSQDGVGNGSGGGGSAWALFGNANVGGVQLSGSAQSGVNTLNLINAHRSANNAQTNVIGIGLDNLLDSMVMQMNIVDESQVNVGNNYGDSLFSKNPTNGNRGGVQLNDWAQYSAHALNLINTNRSANNYQTNIIMTGSLNNDGWYPLQTNLVLDSQLNVGNNDYVGVALEEAATESFGGYGGNSNQGGVQLNGYAQKYASGINISNTNRSANNAQTNIIGAAAGDSVSGKIIQSNEVLYSQQNVGNNGGGGNTGNPEVTASSEEVAVFFGGRKSGNSNVGGVQGNGSAQKHAMGINIINSNRSASNYQLNLLHSVGDVSGCISQSNIVRGSQINVGNNGVSLP